MRVRQRYPRADRLPQGWVLHRRLSYSIGERAVLVRRRDGWKVASALTASGQFQDWWFAAAPDEPLDPWSARRAKIRAIHWSQAIEWVEQAHPAPAPPAAAHDFPAPRSDAAARMLEEITRLAA